MKGEEDGERERGKEKDLCVREGGREREFNLKLSQANVRYCSQ